MMLKNGEKKINNRNLGIELLRVILCFWVLSFHCLNNNKIIIFFISLLKLNFSMFLAFLLYHFIIHIRFFYIEIFQWLKRELKDC